MERADLGQMAYSRGKTSLLVRFAVAAVALLLMAAVPVRLTAAMQPAAEHGAASAESHGESAEGHEEHEGSAIDTVARLVNFAIFAGVLVYLLKAPIRTYLSDRGTQIRADLASAVEMKSAAAAQLAEIERKMGALPGEIEALRAQGKREIAAEGERIRTVAEAERSRLLEQARREIEVQTRIAERDLVAHAAELAVGLATHQIEARITDDDRKRLVDRYVAQLN